MRYPVSVVTAFLVTVGLFRVYAEPAKLVTFNAAGHPKAKGTSFTVAYPSDWSAREGKRPHILQMFVSPDPAEYFTIAVNDLPITSEDERDVLLSKDVVTSLVPEGANLLSHTITKLDGEPCAMLEWMAVLERAGIKIEQRSLVFYLPHKNRLITLVGTAAGLLGDPNVQTKYRFARARFQSIGASLFLSDKWNKSSK